MSFTVTDNSQAVRAFEDAFLTSDEFGVLCSALGLSTTTRLRLQQNPSNRVVLALREWETTPRSRRDLVKVLVDARHGALAAKLGVADAYDAMVKATNLTPHETRVKFNRFALTLYNDMMPADRQTVLMAAGATAGQAATYCDSLSGWMSYLAMQCKFSESDIDMSIWQAFPELAVRVALFYEEMPGATIKGESRGSETKLREVDREKRGDSMHTVEQAAAVRSVNPFGVAPSAPKTFASFVARGGHFYDIICGDMNECEGWYRFLEMNDKLNGQLAAEFVQKLRAQWAKRANNPTNEVFRLLADTDVGDMSYTKLWAQLKSIDNARLSESVEKWKSFCDADAESTKSANKRSFSEASELRGALVNFNICTNENVDEALQKLTDPSIDITTLEDLRTMTQQELQNAGWSLKMAKNCVKILREK